MENLKLLPETVLKPSFDRDKIKASILHIGVSNFHRSHQAYYTHDLIDKFNELNYGICGVDLFDSDRKIYNILKDQDGLYTLYTKEPNGPHRAKIIGSIIEYFFGPENPLAVIEKMASPDIEIISLTIAEDEYHLNGITGVFDMNHPVANEETKNPFKPKTVFGYLTQAFKLRKLRNLPGCTILSCDNMKSNGETMKHLLLDYVSKTEPGLLDWISENTTFPNSMVDRITTITDFDDIDTLKQDFLIEDQWPVVCESFSQWVIEDKFLHKRPSWEKVGVQFTQNIEPYENMKLRLLNAGHTILGILGTMCGYKTVYEAAVDKDFMIFLKCFIDEEVLPTLKESNQTSVKSYKKMLVSRFQNQHINDRLSRICQESSVKIPLFILPTIKDQLQSDKKIKRAAFIIAAWCKYNDGIDDFKIPYKITDSISGTLIRNATLSHQNPIKFLEIESVFGDLSNNKIFTDSYEESLSLLRSNNIKACIQKMNTSLAHK
ncbi:mannitol dehydrogenase family protein [Mariniflexile litorale]|uniref:Mannitol dehydrogenase family protein n=1 Tax=Mariniflexile litorale TaxID=3045158 RepID=A0AAU7EG91_9FLAO|nr:mannitol dehydrogenase family protein [Mariniflexile sp. KMM 9835]MDQ8213491.1 mannitol dehydrogenase family protein [Mariniflexile sp. KMM 9835]